MKKNTIPFLLTLIVVALISSSSIPIQVLKTNLHITVIDDLGNPVEGATVTIFTSASDYQNNTNELNASVTNKKGVCKFKKLETKPYFLDVRKDQLKNDGEGVQTGALAKGKINKVTVVIK